MNADTKKSKRVKRLEEKVKSGELVLPATRGINPSTLETAERIREAWRLHLAGHRNYDISVRLGVSERSVVKYLATARAVAAQVIDEQTVAEIRAVEVERLDAMQVVFFEKAVGGGKGAMGAAYLVLELMRHRAKLLGLEAPVKLDVFNLNVSVSPAELNDHIEHRIKVVEAESTGTDG